MARFNNKFNVLDKDDINAIISFKEQFKDVDDCILDFEIPKSASMDSMIRNECDWQFFKGFYYAGGFPTNYTHDFLLGRKYKIRLRKSSLANKKFSTTVKP